MITKQVLLGGGIALRQITLNDCTTSYVEWLNDPEVNCYLETRWTEQTMESIKDFVKSQRDNTHSVLFAIVLSADKAHIGNIKIGPINCNHKHADISYFIGEKRLWNRGYAKEAIRLATKFGFEELKLHRVEAGVYAGAVGSWRALERNGFVREAVFREQVFWNGRFMDVFRYGILESEYKIIRQMEETAR